MPNNIKETIDEQYIDKIRHLMNNPKAASFDKFFSFLSVIFIPFSVIFWENHNATPFFLLYFSISLIWTYKNMSFFITSSKINPIASISAIISFIGVFFLKNIGDIGLIIITISCAITLFSEE